MSGTYSIKSMHTASPGTDLNDLPAPCVLAVSSQLPWPLNSGGNIRSFHLLQALARQFRVRLIAPGQGNIDQAVKALRGRRISVSPVTHSGRSWLGEIPRLAAALRCGEPYVLYRRHYWTDVEAAVRDQIGREQPDVVYLDHLDSLVYHPIFDGTPLVLDNHNVCSQLLGLSAQAQSRWWMRSFLSREARRLEKMECSAAGMVSSVLAVSDQEAEHYRLRGARRVFVVPNGVDCEAYCSLPTGRLDGPPTVLYVGAMSWEPNIEAVTFLARRVLPVVRASSPDVRLRIIGRNPAAEVLALAALPGVEVSGTVANVVPYLREAHLLAVPLEVGGGTRIKILEAFAAGLPVVSTPVGCEGLHVTDGKHLIVMPREHFAEGILMLLRNRALHLRLAQEARLLARESYDWSMVGELACQAVRAALAARAA